MQLLHGPVRPNDEIDDPSIVTLSLNGLADTPGQYRFEGSFRCEQVGRYGFALRVMPSHADLAVPAELGRVAWAE